MNNTKIFELCETKKQCTDCYFSSGRSALFIDPVEDVLNCRTKEFDKNNYDVLSIPGYVIKKDNTRGAEHGPSERQRMYCKAKEMLQEGRQPKHGGFESILERCKKDDKHRKSLSVIGWTEERIIRMSQQDLKECNMQTLGTQIESRRCSTTTKSMTLFCSSKTRMQKSARRTCEKDPTRIQTKSS